MKKTLALSLIFLLSITFASAQSTSKNEKVKQLLELSGSGKLGIQVMNSMISNFKKNAPNVPNEFWTDFMSEIKPEDLENMIIPIYEKYYSEQDIDNIIIFYQTPTGKKMLETLPQVMQESMQVGQQWGAALGEKIVNKMKEKGYKK